MSLKCHKRGLQLQRGEEPQDTDREVVHSDQWRRQQQHEQEELQPEQQRAWRVEQIGV